jgi:branched-chain amino acid transport system permease protein
MPADRIRPHRIRAGAEVRGRVDSCEGVPSLLTATVILVDGMVFAAWLFVVSVGLTLIYGVMRILNIAHGSFYALGAYTAVTLIGVYFAQGYMPLASYALLPLSALAVGLIAGLAIERGVLRIMYGRDEVVMVLVTYAVFLILEDVIKLVWGVDPHFAFEPYALLGTIDILGLPYLVYDLFTVVLAIVIGAAMWWGLNRTQAGKLLVALIHDREMSMALGVNARVMFTATFVIGAFLAALGGAVSAPKIAVVPGIGVEVIVLAFAVVVIGGLGSIGGAMIGAVIVGLARATAVHLLPTVELFVIYAAMTAVLAVRRHGLFARAEARKI